MRCVRRIPLGVPGLVVLLLSGLALAACTDRPPTTPTGSPGSGSRTFSRVEIAPADIHAITPGESRQLSAKVVYSDGGIDDITSLVTWQSGNTVVATV